MDDNDSNDLCRVPELWCQRDGFVVERTRTKKKKMGRTVFRSWLFLTTNRSHKATDTIDGRNNTSQYFERSM